MPLIRTLALRMPCPSAVVTRPEMARLAAVDGINCSCQPPFTQPVILVGASTNPASSRMYRLHTPFELLRRKLPVSVCVPVPPTVLPGSLYGPGGAGAGKLLTGVSQFVGSNVPVVNAPESGKTAPAESLNVSVTPGIESG